MFFSSRFFNFLISVVALLRASLLLLQSSSFANTPTYFPHNLYIIAFLIASFDKCFSYIYIYTAVNLRRLSSYVRFLFGQYCLPVRVPLMLTHYDICLDTVLVFLLRESDTWCEVCRRTVSDKSCPRKQSCFVH